MQPSTTLGFAYIEQFRCLADQCPNNCCHDWRIALEEEQVQRYRNHPSLLNAIVKDETGYSMRQKNTRCVCNQQGICIIHRDYGESLLSNTCMNYPRMYRSLNQFYTRAGTLSCPEIARKCMFDDDPFRLIKSELPPNHQQGQGLTQGLYDDLTPTLWQHIISSLIDMILDEKTEIEENILQLLSLASKLNANDVSDWPTLIANQRAQNLRASSPETCHSTVENDPIIEHNSETEEEGMARAERSTALLMVLLEHIDRPNTPEYIRQGVINAFKIVTYEQPKCRLLPMSKSYYQTYGRHWIQHSLKRFTATEITRVGFPFVSITSAGQNYGKSLTEWATTLCLRILSLRLLLTTLGARTAENGTAIPEDSALVEWVFEFSRRANHQPKGPHEIALFHQLLNHDGSSLNDYLEIEHL
jgi:lysine-N-methylase